MPKNFVLESVRHQLLRSLERARQAAPASQRDAWEAVGRTLELRQKDNDGFEASWSAPRAGSVPVDRGEFRLYQRGDVPSGPAGAALPANPNASAADAVAARIGALLGLSRGEEDGRLAREETFHDQWAASVRPEQVMVRESFEACTAPEHRFILSLLGDIKGKRLLDLGSGLGEASVYFALRGASVTACDLSSEMLRLASRAAAHHGVSVSLHCAPAERTGLPESGFDIVYAGNLLHHVDVAPVLDEVRRLLSPGGVFVSWDPLAHNPVINVYRGMASAVRTIDEHPLRMQDLELFRSRFRDVRWRSFWLFTLAVFLRFYFWERVNPSEERYWKKILTDAGRLETFYKRLERLDQIALRAFPSLGRYCWNIVIWGRK